MGSGKTALMNLLANKYRTTLECRPNSLLYNSPTHALSFLGVVFDGKWSVQPELRAACDDHMVVLMLDDCQNRYGPEYTEFWANLVKTAATWFPERLRLIICATRSLKTLHDSPACFSELASLGRQDFIITTEESHKFLELMHPTGLHTSLLFPVVKDAVVRECGGLIVALRITVNFLNMQFAKESDFTVDKVLGALFSGTYNQQLGRCFTTKKENISVTFHRLLVQLLTDSIEVSGLTDAQKDTCNELVITGVLCVSPAEVVEFASPLAARFLTTLLFPYRAAPDTVPSSLTTLVLDAISLMSASALCGSVVSGADRPKEAVYQHMFLQSLHKLTSANSSICPELSRVFPVDNGVAMTPKIAGELDFYINGTLRWGIELLIDGAGVGEHVNRFAGKYAPLCVSDYIVVDFRVGRVTNVKLHEKRMTVFFGKGFIDCSVKVGLEKDAKTVTLQD